MRSLTRNLATILAATALISCGDSTGPDADNEVGSYDLVTVNGGALPFTVLQIGNDRVEVTEGRITLNADGTFSDRVTVRITESGSSTTDEEVAQGTYVRNANAITLTTTDGEQYALSFSNGDTLTQTVEGFVLVYRR